LRVDSGSGILSGGTLKILENALERVLGSGSGIEAATPLAGVKWDQMRLKTVEISRSHCWSKKRFFLIEVGNLAAV